MCRVFFLLAERNVGQLFPAEEQKHDDTDGDAGIGEIEDGAEEGVWLSTIDGEPFGQDGGEQGEIEHVDHLSHQERCIATSERNPVRYIVGRGTAEAEAVEHRVEDVAGCSCRHHGKQDDVEGAGFLLYLQTDEIAKHSHGKDAEDGEKDLWYERHSVCHSVVLDEVYLEPGCNLDSAIKSHISLYPNLDNLVND